MAASSTPLPRALFGVETEYAFALWVGPKGTMPPDRAAALLDAELSRRPGLSPGFGRSGLFLGNGGRFYVDAGHPEYCTPEVSNPYDAVRHVAAGDRLLGEAAAAVLASAKRYRRCLLTRCNVDFSGTRATWGQHESYLCRRPIKAMAQGLVPHMTTRIVFKGAGGFDNRGVGMNFVLSPRAMHLCSIVSSSSTEARGIIHTRDESHASAEWHRLHMTYGEALCSQLAMFLKLGTTSLVVLTLDHNPDAFVGLALKDPLAAAFAIARDPLMRETLRLQSGQEMGVLELQRGILAVVERYAGTLEYPEWTGEVFRLWRSTLDALERSPMELVGKLDWPTKLALYRDHLLRAGFDEDLRERCNRVREWLEHEPAEPAGAGEGPAATLLLKAAAWYEASKARMARRAAAHAGVSMKQLEHFDKVRAQLFELDSRYGAIGGEGIFESMDSSGVLAHRVVSDEEIASAMTEPPCDTRANRRGRAVLELSAGERAEAHCNWSYVNQRDRQLDLRDPFRHDVEWEPRPDQPEAEAEGAPF